MFHDTPLLIVEDDRTLRDVALRLARSSVVAVDTESDSMYHYQEKVCLIQFTDAHGDIIVDPLSVRDLSPLVPIFENPKIVKVFHGADYDIVCLRRDFGMKTRNLFDTLIAGQFLGYDKLGYADLVRNWFGQELDKQYQRYDWSRRPLGAEHLDYARGDTHWLPALREIMLRQLRAAGRVAHHTEECKLLEAREWQRRPFDESGWARIKGGAALDDDGKRVLRRLFLYRDDAARQSDRPPYKTISDHVLLDIARVRPRSARALADLLPTMHGLRRRHENGLIDCVLDGLEDPFPTVSEPETVERVRGPRARLNGRAADRAFEALKVWRNQIGQDAGQTSAVSIASNNTLRNIAKARPFDLTELREVPEVRAWQVRDFGPQLLAVLDEIAPAGELDAQNADDAPSKSSRRRRR